MMAIGREFKQKTFFLMKFARTIQHQLELWLFVAE